MPVYPADVLRASTTCPGCWCRDRRPRYPSDLSDAQWQVLRPEAEQVMDELRRAAGRPMVHDLRAMADAIGYVARNGIEWRALPLDFPPCTLYHFAWDDFCDWYVELAKTPLAGADAERPGLGWGGSAGSGPTGSRPESLANAAGRAGSQRHQRRRLRPFGVCSISAVRVSRRVRPDGPRRASTAWLTLRTPAAATGRATAAAAHRPTLFHSTTAS